jgi:hypothetical protein
MIKKPILLAITLYFDFISVSNHNSITEDVLKNNEIQIITKMMEFSVVDFKLRR